ncbi:arsenite-activated ATPase ArsA [Pyrobaculum oguniense TE7]|uniref:Arsenite-activated ATPase ArsA n=1 Tax=Pyrobaculum oguniense (strain DSM 13380 / JCM 10595 / TE7) TaxID=698757 RepID=H6QCM3_PYROT|nr:arsenite-activated ATPase ArsA [Pyrobaculum oguniense TE7]
MTHLVFLGGKGGVGKTTLSCAIAYQLAVAGRRTLLVSTDPAHSVGDVLDMEIGPAPRRVVENLYAVELDLEKVALEKGKRVIEVAAKIVPPDIYEAFSKYVDAVVRGPGVDEYVLVEKTLDYANSGYDFVVFDTAPIGHTFKLLQLPDLLRRWLELLKRQRLTYVKLSRNIAKLKGETHRSDPLLDFLEATAKRIEATARILKDPNATSFFLVANPEKVVLDETIRFIERLKELGIPLKGVIMNKHREQITPRVRHMIEKISNYIVAYVSNNEDEVYGIEKIAAMGKMIGSVLQILNQSGK